MTRRIEHRLIVASLGGLCLLLALSLLLPPSAHRLNRLPEPRPALRPLALFDAEYRQAWETYLGDKLAIGRYARSANTSIELTIFGDTPSQDVVAGKDDWLFFAPAIAALANDATALDAAAASATMLLDRLEQRGVQARFLPAPHKPSYAAQYLPQYLQDDARLARLNRDALMDALATDPRVINVFPPMTQASARFQAGQLYYPQDTHWTPLGASIAARAVLDSLAPGLWSEAAFQQTEPLTYTPDLLRMQNLQVSIAGTGWAVIRPGVQTQRTETQTRFYAEARYSSDSDAEPLLPPLLLIGDSYAEAVAPLLAPYFEQVTLVRLHRGMTMDALEPALATEPHFVLIEIVERHLTETAPVGLVGLERYVQP